ncbi:MAG: lipoyl(octanoyl) transferase LipB [Sedimentisphaerales bacterium]|nr:lipoyl(octanoyl) transferase LipB [Sedimentisphaerales bacterium]
MVTSNIKPKIKRLEIIDCGLADYAEILQKQYQLRDKRLAGEIFDTILIVEHKAVITIGARKTANKLLLTKDQFAEKGIELVEIRRGGGVTAHNPGQLVFYPILNIKERRIGVSEYVRELEQIGIELLEKLDIKAKRKKGYPGLWVNERKIASIGVRVSKGITHHGMAVNINNDLGIFDYIVPCGLKGIEMTSVLKETGKKNSMEKVKNTLCEILQEHFG